ncbi:hypothetical protein R69608_07893 [Paraburkholderia nemoris]|uniref:hypothetical protein n=1 Tax=Paraburkholderia nemoris TaxID=2793076 RepID=UPI001B0D259B|nr:hypothetical protein [Paraburkholderia nemoris]CAE6972921.1 hypothetical protein R69608_07893 [Paraburkholderia nemoris]
MRYVSDADSYQRIVGQATNLMSWQIGDGPSGTSRRYFDWLEFLVKGFWTYIVELARLSGDTTIYFYDLEQAKTSVFAKRFSVYPLVQLDVGMSEAAYIAALNEEPGEVQGETFAVANTNSYLIFPQSGKWRVLGEYSIEMAELASSVGAPADAMFPHDFWDETEALRRIKSAT